MGKKWLVLVILAAAAAAAWWYFARGADQGARGASGLPAIRVKESSLTPAGKEELARVRKKVRELKKADTARKFDDSLEIESSLRKLGDYESSAEWSLKRVEWLEELSPEERRATKYGKRDYTVVAATCYEQACQCYCLRGETDKAIELLGRFLKSYPKDSMGWRLARRNYETLTGNPDSYLARAAKFKGNPRYVKSAP